MFKKSKQSICPICDKKLSFLKSTIKDGIKVCTSHTVAARLYLAEDIDNATVEEIQKRMKTIQASEKKERDKISNFNTTKKIGNIQFDDTNKKILISNGYTNDILDHEDIIEFEIVEDGDVVSSGGVGRAIVGGILFGGTGAIVGAVTAKKEKKFSDSLHVKITINNLDNPTVHIPFITKKTKIDSDTYKLAASQAQELISTLQVICN